MSGKITGDPNYREKFEKGVAHFEAMDWPRSEIVNPVDHCPETWSWWRCMGTCLRLLVGCEFVGMLPDWRESRGARIEHAVAMAMRKWIVYVKF